MKVKDIFQSEYDRINGYFLDTSIRFNEGLNSHCLTVTNG